METTDKRGWATPELIVLVRSHLEEGVLAACKGAGGAQAPTNFDGACLAITDCATPCTGVAPS
jgi:hypothetical protein